MSTEKIYFIAIAAVPMLFSIVFHEVAHGWMANKLGDSTAKNMGRVTLNPIPHIDPIGTVLVPIILMIMPGNFFFGWAKPVPFNPYNFYNHINMRKGTMWVAAAGPLSNLILATISAFCFVAVQRFFPNETVLTFFYIGVFFNILLGFFNMLPIPPLDGSKVLMGLLPREYDRFFMNMERYGFFILIFLIATGALRVLLMPINAIVGLIIAVPQFIFSLF
jgi:Zn-dependent protease